MVTELLVRLKSLLNEMGDLIHLATGSAKWETVVRISPERAGKLADVCDEIRPMLDDLSRLLGEVSDRARKEMKELR